jgi:hypothetical protein
VWLDGVRVRARVHVRVYLCARARRWWSWGEGGVIGLTRNTFSLFVWMDCVVVLHCVLLQ